VSGLSPAQMILVGLALAVLGVALPLLMVLQLLPNNFLLNFLGFAASVVGLILGVIGMALYVRVKRSDRQW